MKSLILFASGKGSNARAVIRHFERTGTARVCMIVCNNPTAGVLDIAAEHNIPSRVIDRQTLNDAAFVAELQQLQPDLLVLAGFLWKMPDGLVAAFNNAIINIHPALLPRYGGKGMYGKHVHAAVLAAGDTESGITIHYVNEHYDEGNHILQAHCPVLPGDTPETLAGRVAALEHCYFPVTIEYLLANNKQQQ
jgi:phosphoribosylglycinamide formyltransferase-1